MSISFVSSLLYTRAFTALASPAVEHGLWGHCSEAHCIGLHRRSSQTRGSNQCPLPWQKVARTTRGVPTTTIIITPSSFPLWEKASTTEVHPSEQLSLWLLFPTFSYPFRGQSATAQFMQQYSPYCTLGTCRHVVGLGACCCSESL